MKKLLFFALIAFGISFSNAQVGTYNVGDVVGDFTVTDTKGNVHNLYDITASGKYVFIDFFYTECGYCMVSQKYFNELFDKYGCNSGDIFTISVSTMTYDTNSKIEQYETTYGGTFHHAPAAGVEGGANEVCDQYGVDMYPTYCLIGPDNKLVDGDIYPIASVQTYENAFPDGFDPQPMECTMSASDVEANMVSLYPSVSNGSFTIALPKVLNATVQVMDLSGKQVFSKKFEAVSKANLQLNVPSGIYLVKVTTNDKQANLTQKIIIK